MMLINRTISEINSPKVVAVGVEPKGLVGSARLSNRAELPGQLREQQVASLRDVSARSMRWLTTGNVR